MSADGQPAARREQRPGCRPPADAEDEEDKAAPAARKKVVADGYGDGYGEEDADAGEVGEKLSAAQRENKVQKAAEKAGEEEEDSEHHTVNLFNKKIKVPKDIKPVPPPPPKKKYTPPPIPDVCDGEHCAGCLAESTCEEHGDHCMWNKKKKVCYPKKIKLFGHEIDLTKLHNEEM